MHSIIHYFGVIQYYQQYTSDTQILCNEMLFGSQYICLYNVFFTECLHFIFINEMSAAERFNLMDT